MNRLRSSLFARFLLTAIYLHCNEEINLINQLSGFRTEKHDDMVDALVWLILGVAQDGVDKQVVTWV